MILDLVKIGASLIDKIIPDKQAASEAKLKLIALQQSGELAELQASKDIVVAEAQSEHTITATWRPIVMLTFTGLVVAHFLGFTAPKHLRDSDRRIIKDSAVRVDGLYRRPKRRKGNKGMEKTTLKQRIKQYLVDNVSWVVGSGIFLIGFTLGAVVL